MILEEDTALILTAPSIASLATEPAVRVMTDLYFNAERRPGEVVVRSTRPLELLAVVLDLDAQPVTTLDVVRVALQRVLAIAAARKLREIVMEPLGCRTGPLEMEAFCAALCNVLRTDGAASGLARITCLDPECAPYERPSRRNS
ncbi:MAG: hypothetical protein AAF458_14385 [Pseudomonadota bacterium]